MEDQSKVATLASYLIKKGLTDSQINQLIEYSNSDPNVIKFTHDHVRFKDRTSYEEFTKDNVTYYALTDTQDNLLGIVWFQLFKIPTNDENYKNYGITYAIRLYGEARGKGLSKEFSKIALNDFKKTEEYNKAEDKGIWLSTSPDNIPAIKLYEDLGFKKIGFVDEWKKDLMILK